MGRFRIGIDTGGTFTDIVATDVTSGATFATKTPSTPDDPSRALLNGVDKILKQAAGSRSELESLIHGTTVATNALLEQGFGSIALITTEGFRHILEIARQSVPSGYGNSYFWVKPERIVPLHRVYEVSGRLNFRGETLRELVPNDVRRIARQLIRAKISTVAISLIHAYANPEHERRVRDILLEEIPNLTMSLSSDVLPEYREYERTMTTCIDAYVKPVMQRYIRRADTLLAVEESRHHPTFLIMQSNGGVRSSSEVAKQPISTLLSGPAAGALGASYLAGLAGYDHVLTVDAGGTSTDICLVDDCNPHITNQGSIDHFPIKLPMVDVATIGTGGGSIAWLDPSGALRVGPKSAGADPGPMAYGRGGSRPTLTDANVVLGRLPPRLLGGEMNLDVDKARSGMQELAERSGLSAERVAVGIIEIADWNQVNAIRQVTVRKGLDPRDYTMVSFGGSGPLQAPHVADLLGLKRVLIPPDPGNVSAYGLLAVDIKTDYVATSVQREDRLDLDVLNALFCRLEEAARQDLRAQGVPEDRTKLVHSVDVRYVGEAYEVTVPATGVYPMTVSGITSLTKSFHTEHTRLYGYSYEGEQLCEIVNLRITALGLVDRPRLLELPSAVPLESPQPVDSRTVDDLGRGPLTTPVFARTSLQPGHRLTGPAVIEEYGSTTVLPSGWNARIDSRLNLVLEKEAQ